MSLFNDYKKRFDKITASIKKQLDTATRQRACEDLAKFYIDLMEDYDTRKLSDEEWITLSVMTYNIRDALLLLK